MGANSSIEWTDHSFNPWVGCTKISPGCDHCYAEGWAKRSGLVKWGAERRRTSEENWRQPLKWNAEAKRAGIRRRVFCASLADVFDNEVPEQWRADLFALILKTPNLDWLLLTKRIGNVRTMVPWDRPDGAPSEVWPLNIWLGATIVNQAEADRDIPKLLAVPARVRFLSCEPLLGPLVLRKINVLGHGWYDCLQGWRECSDWGGRENLIDWVIIGGESGPGARPFTLGWAKDIVRHCRASGVPVFVKQVGSNPVNREGERCPHIRDRKGKVTEEWPEELRVREFPEVRQ